MFAQAVSDGSVGAASNDNLVYVQDAIIASNATVTTTITLGDGAVLRNFGGMSAVRATGEAKLVMEPGSVIEDASSITRSKGDAGSVGPAGAVWLQGSDFEMENGAEIKNVNGRAVYADGGSVSVGGTISGIIGNPAMWQGKDGTAIHLRGSAKATLNGKISDCTEGVLVFVDKAVLKWPPAPSSAIPMQLASKRTKIPLGVLLTKMIMVQTAIQLQFTVKYLALKTIKLQYSSSSAHC